MPDAHRFYTQQYAGDMSAQFGEHRLSLLQVWSEEDFIRLQENLIGHLVTQNVSAVANAVPATTESEMTMVSLCNVSGNVVLEQFGSDKRTLLAATLGNFLDALRPVLTESRRIRRHPCERSLTRPVRSLLIFSRLSPGL